MKTINSYIHQPSDIPKLKEQEIEIENSIELYKRAIDALIKKDIMPGMVKDLEIMIEEGRSILRHIRTQVDLIVNK